MATVRLNASLPIAGPSPLSLEKSPKPRLSRSSVTTGSHCCLELSNMCRARWLSIRYREQIARCAERKQMPLLVTVSESVRGGGGFNNHSTTHPAQTLKSTHQYISTSIRLSTPQTFHSHPGLSCISLLRAYPPPSLGSSLKFRGPLQRELTSGGGQPFYKGRVGPGLCHRLGTWWTRPLLASTSLPSFLLFPQSCSFKSK